MSIVAPAEVTNQNLPVEEEEEEEEDEDEEEEEEDDEEEEEEWRTEVDGYGVLCPLLFFFFA